MKQRLSIIFALTALIAVLLTGCSIQESASAVLPVVGTVAGNLAGAVEQQLPTVAAQADAALQEVSQTLPEATAEVASDQTPQPELIEPVPVAPSSQVTRTIGVSCATNDWIASVRTTFGVRSTWRISTRSIRDTATSRRR